MAGTTACVFVFSVLLELILCGAESSQVHGTRNPREFFFSSTVRLHRFDSQTTDQNRLGGRTTNGMESSQSTRGEGGGAVMMIKAVVKVLQKAAKVVKVSMNSSRCHPVQVVLVASSCCHP